MKSWPSFRRALLFLGLLAGLLLPQAGDARLKVNRLDGFNDRPVQVLIGSGVGNAIGDLTSNGGLATSFDDDTTELVADCSRATAAANDYYVGKNFLDSKRAVVRVKIYGPSNNTWTVGNGGTVTFKLRGSKTTPTGPTDGTVISRTVSSDNTTFPVTAEITDIPPNSFKYVWVNATTSTATDMAVCEVEWDEVR